MLNFLSSSLFFQAQVFEDVSDEGFFLWPMLAFVCLILTLVFLFLGIINIQTYGGRRRRYYFYNFRRRIQWQKSIVTFLQKVMQL